MADSDQNLDNRMWRLEQQQKDIFIRLDKIDEKIEELNRRQGDRMFRVETLEHRLAEIEKKPLVAVGGVLGDSTLRIILYSLVSGILVLAGAQAVNLTGLLK